MKRNHQLAKFLAVALGLVLACSLLFSCGGPKNLEEYINSDEDVKSEIEETAKDNGMEVTVKENLVTYSVTLDSTVSDSMLDTYKQAFVTEFDKYESTFSKEIKDIEEETELTGVQFEVIVKDQGGTTLYDQKFDSNGKVE